MEPSEPDDLLGTVLAERYRLETQIGEGGIGRVYKARHLTLGNFVAVKVLLAQYQDREVLRKRFEREASALAELSHPNIVKVADFGVHEGMPFLVMELLEGADLAALAHRGVVTPERGIGVIKQVLRALAYAHERGVVHRDIKPHNVFVRDLGDGIDHVQVLDFGLARFHENRDGEKPLTRTGTVLGTPAYMSPEQATGERVDATADVYSVGVMLYEVVCGRRPFHSDNPSELLRMHILEPPPAPSEVRPGLVLDDGLQALLDSALAKSRGDRFEDARPMLAALDAIAAPIRESGAPPAPTPAEELGTARTLAASDPTSAERPGAKAARPTPPPENTRLWLVAVVALLGLGVIGSVVAWQLSGDEADPPATASSPATPETPPDAPSAPPTGVEPPTAPAPAADPMAGDLPEPLAELHGLLTSGRVLSRGQRGQLNRYIRAHPQDPRPHLLLGRSFTEERSLSYALPEYRDAYSLDPSVTAYAPMLVDLLEMVRSNALNRPASELVVEAYGAAAVPEIERQLAERMRRDEQQRLERVRAEIEAP